MKTRLTNTLLAVVLAVFSFSCANQVAPTGGTKDVDAPKVLGSSPPNKSLNFQERKVRILFDEYVSIENAQQQVVISPPMEKFPDFTIKGKELIISFKDTLRANTTYSINITSAVKDITENNVLTSFQYVFSTGSFLDSLTIKGKVVDAEAGTMVEGVLVMLYDKLQDSVVFSEKPYYFAKTDKSGSFQIDNIKEGTYKLFAVKDENFNLKYDLPTEGIAYWEVSINISDSALAPFTLRLFKEESKRLQMVENITTYRGFNQFIYSMPVEQVSVKPLLDTLSFSGNIIEYNATRDTVTHWYTYNKGSKSVLLVTANDTLTDSLVVRAPTFVADSLYKIGKPGLFLGAGKGKRTTNTADKMLDLGQPFLFELNRPAAALDSSRVYLLEDTTKSVQPQVYFADSVKRIVAVNFIWKPGSSYKIVFLDSAITDNYGLKSDSLGFDIIARKADDYGVITIAIDSLDPTKQYILEASLTDGQPIIREVIMARQQFVKKYEKLVPGNYKVRIIRDANRNGLWDTGDYLKNRQPERIYLHPQTVDLKPNWEMELEIEMDK